MNECCSVTIKFHFKLQCRILYGHEGFYTNSYFDIERKVRRSVIIKRIVFIDIFNNYRIQFIL